METKNLLHRENILKYLRNRGVSRVRAEELLFTDKIWYSFEDIQTLVSKFIESEDQLETQTKLFYKFVSQMPNPKYQIGDVIQFTDKLLGWNNTISLGTSCKYKVVDFRETMGYSHSYVSSSYVLLPIRKGAKESKGAKQDWVESNSVLVYTDRE